MHINNVIPPVSSISRLNNQSLFVLLGLWPSSGSLRPSSGLSLLHVFLSCSGGPNSRNTPGVLSPRLSRKEGSPLLVQAHVPLTISSAFTGKLLSSQTPLVLFGLVLGVYFSSRAGLKCFPLPSFRRFLLAQTRFLPDWGTALITGYHNPLSLSVQPNLNPLQWPLAQSLFSV